jgi:hypothetical protein
VFGEAKDFVVLAFVMIVLTKREHANLVLVYIPSLVAKTKERK